MVSELKLNYFNFPLCILGGGVLPIVCTVLNVGFIFLLLLVFVWVCILFVVYLLGKRILWLEDDKVYVMSKGNRFVFERSGFSMMLRGGRVLSKITVGVRGQEVDLSLPFCMPEEHQQKFVLRVKKYCAVHNLKCDEQRHM